MLPWLPGTSRPIVMLVLELGLLPWLLCTCRPIVMLFWWCCYGYLVLLEFAVDHDGGLLVDALADAVCQAVVTLHVSAVLVIILLLTVPIATERKVNTARHKS